MCLLVKLNSTVFTQQFLLYKLPRYLENRAIILIENMTF